MICKHISSSGLFLKGLCHQCEGCVVGCHHRDLNCRSPDYQEKVVIPLDRPGPPVQWQSWFEVKVASVTIGYFALVVVIRRLRGHITSGSPLWRIRVCTSILYESMCSAVTVYFQQLFTPTCGIHREAEKSSWKVSWKRERKVVVSLPQHCALCKNCISLLYPCLFTQIFETVPKGNTLRVEYMNYLY